MEKMEKWKEFLSKRIKVVFEDGVGHFSKKEGVLFEVTETHALLKIGLRSEAINLSKILRVEELL